MIRKRTNSVLNMMNLLFILFIFTMTVSTIFVIVVQFHDPFDIDQNDPQLEESVEDAAIMMCGVLFMAGIVALAILGLMIATGVMMILSRKDYEMMERIGLISGIALLSGLGASVLLIIPFLNIILIPLVSVAIYGSMIYYLHSLNSSGGRKLCYIAGGLLGVGILLVFVNNLASLFIWNMGEITILSTILSSLAALFEIPAFILLMISISRARENLEEYDITGTDDGSGSGGYDYQDQVQPGRMKAPKDGWLSYETNGSGY